MLLHEDHDSIVASLAFSPDGSLLASAARDGSILIRDPHGESSTLRPSIDHRFDFISISLLSNESALIALDAGWEVIEKTNGLWPLQGAGQKIQTTAAAPLSERVIAVGIPGMFQLHDRHAKRPLHPTFREPHGVRAIATCPEKKHVAWSTGDKQLKVWDISKQTPVAIRTSHVASALALAPDGSAVAAVQDWAVRVNDLNAKQDLPPLKGHKGVVSCVAFSPTGSFIATGSWDGTVRFWDPRTGQERAVFQWPIGKVFSLAFAPDGLRLAAGGDRGAVVVWDVE